MSTTSILPHLKFRCRIVGTVSSESPPRRGAGNVRGPRCRYAQADCAGPIPVYGIARSLRSTIVASTQPAATNSSTMAFAYRQAPRASRWP